MNRQLTGKKIAVIATHGFEESELLESVEGLREAGATVEILGPEGEQELKAWKSGDWSTTVKVDGDFVIARSDNYDGLLIPGGTLNADKLRMDIHAVEFVKDFFKQGKPVAAICHGPQLLIEAGVVKGRKLTSYKSIKTDLINAGASWSDSEVIYDDGLITSRSPSDITAFVSKIVEVFRESSQMEQPAV